MLSYRVYRNDLSRAASRYKLLLRRCAKEFRCPTQPGWYRPRRSRDPFGQGWRIATHQEGASIEEMKQGSSELTAASEEAK